MEGVSKVCGGWGVCAACCLFVVVVVSLKKRFFAAARHHRSIDQPRRARRRVKQPGSSVATLHTTHARTLPRLPLVELQLRVVGVVLLAVVRRADDLAERGKELGRQVDGLERDDGRRVRLLLRHLWWQLWLQLWLLHLNLHLRLLNHICNIGRI